MSKPRARTIQQRFGFIDKDLKTPLHDQIMLWLNENIVDMMGHLVNAPQTWKQAHLI